MEFFINQNATLPYLKMQLVQDGRNDFRDFHEKIQNANIWFNMTDIVTGNKKVAMQVATCIPKVSTCPDDIQEYYIGYKFKSKDTKKAGDYEGQFTIEFLDGSGTLIVPIREKLHIHVLEK
jgi:hypothetical protein